jgi:hypothetical protein
VGAVRGIALLEMAVWSVVLLPLLLFGVNIAATVHDQIRLRQIPISALREFSVVGQVVQMEAGRVALTVNHAALGAMLVQIRARLLEDAQRSVLGGVSHLSAVACYWVLSGQPSSGARLQQLHERCERGGARADGLSLQGALAEYTATLAGRSLTGAATTWEGAHTVLLGAAVGGEVWWMFGSAGRDLVQFNQIALPHEEVTL